MCWCPLGGLQRRKGPHGVSKATRPFIFRENSVKEGDKKIHLLSCNFSRLEHIVFISEGGLVVGTVHKWLSIKRIHWSKLLFFSIMVDLISNLTLYIYRPPFRVCLEWHHVFFIFLKQQWILREYDSWTC